MKSINKKAKSVKTADKSRKVTIDTSLSSLKDIPFSSGKDQEIKELKFKLSF